MEHDISVIALAPNGGKTEISVDIISRFIALFPNEKALVLTHSTKVLKDNFTNRLDGLSVNFTYSESFDKNTDVHICLPNSEHKIKQHYGLIIVDEAHENYLAERVQRIVKKIKPIKQVLLTATPSKFIYAGGYNICFLALNELPEEYFAKLSIEMVASSYDWTNEMEVPGDFNFTENASKETLHAVVLKLLERVKSKLTATEFNNPSLWTKTKMFLFTFKKMGKTMFICKSIKQARHINAILLHEGVNSCVSDSISDIDSQKISEFKNNEYDVLVVIDRARLGYSDESLYNIIDMSGTMNPDIIYQTLCRVVRGDQTMRKLYMKVTSQSPAVMDITTAAVCAGLMLTDRQFLSTFNGYNFNGIQIPVLKELSTKRRKKEKDDVDDIVDVIDKPTRPVFPAFTFDTIKLFKSILCNLDNEVSIYKMTTIGEVKRNLGIKPHYKWHEKTDDELLAELSNIINNY